MKLSIKKGDYVKIIAGNDKGKMAQVISIDVDKQRVLLEGKNLGVIKKSVKAKKANDPSGIIDRPRSYAVSNVMPVCASCGSTTRIKHSIVDGKKVRICECGAVLETKKVATKDEAKKSTTVRKKKKAEDAVEVADNTAVNTESASEATEVKTEAAPVKAKATTVKKTAAKAAATKVEE